MNFLILISPVLVLCLLLAVPGFLLYLGWKHLKKAQAIALEPDGLATRIIPGVAFGGAFIILCKLILF